MRRASLATFVTGTFVAIVFGDACTRDPITHADNVVVADDATAPTSPSTAATTATTATTIASASAVASASNATDASGDAAPPGPRPLTMDEVADRCGYKGSLICCLGPPIAGPPPKPYCYPAQ
jgi:hypothetical protein